MTTCQICVALDVANPEAARQLVARLGNRPLVYKIGYHLLFEGGLALADELVAKGHQVFLDAKLHDIGNTVEGGVRSLSARGYTYLTVHAYPQTMRAAAQGAANTATKILAVSVLTSYTQEDLHEAGYETTLGALVAKRATQAVEAGLHGLVCSAEDLAWVRPNVPAHFCLTTPGIRLPEDQAGDQKRIMTPQKASHAGANLLVVGRPIVNSPDPALAADKFLQSLSQSRS